MPPGYVKTIRKKILYEYAKLISRSAYGSILYPFVADRFKKLRNGQITISGTMREWEREQELPHQCVFCGSPDNLSTDHLIPRNRGGDGSSDNLVQACTSCNSSRGDKGVFEWLGLEEKDKLHRLVAEKYLKQLLKIQEQAKTIDISMDQLKELGGKCPLPEVCKEWKKVGELTCFCLESVLAKV
jgi:HNH endonuclease